MEHLALSHPDIAIKFIQNGQIKFHTSGNNNLKEVIYRIYGKDVTEALNFFEMEIGECGRKIKVSGFLGRPELNRSNRSFETYFVNGRFVKNDIITKALEEGYRTYLMQHKFPFCILHFSIPPDLIDVNVHPAKMEIRLIQGMEIFEKLSKGIQNYLKDLEMIPSVILTAEKDEKKIFQKSPEPFEIERSQMMLREDNVEYQKNVISAAAKQEMPKEPSVKDFLHKIGENRIIGSKTDGNSDRNDGIHANVIKADEHILVERPKQFDLFEENFLTKEAKNEYKIMGQLFETYWLVAFHDKLFIIDQHAAHEKVKYERLVKELEGKHISSQMLNPPVIINLTSREEEVLNEYLKYFADFGFEIEEFGGSSYSVRSMPIDLYGCNEKQFFTEILDELMDSPMKGTPEVILNKLASMACKAAVKGNQELSEKEACALIDELLTLENPYHCPHGRPTIISMGKYEIEKKFKRVL